ncbi:SAC3-GANP domain-containing protein [Fusarium sp. LHS14.1]|nr:SAC3-GANP domain-containing protein [Fusarium sp. LHS14.1]
MTSIFGQPTRSQPPAFNPFATNSAAGDSSFGIDDAGDSNRSKRNKRSSRPADKSDNEGKRKSNKDANMSDGGKQKKWKAEERKRKNGDVKKSFEGAKPLKKAPKDAQTNGFNPFTSTRDNESRPTSSSSTESQTDGIPKAYHSNDPQARQVYEQLRKDNIFPPPWPSQPGNPKNKGEVGKFREKYEAYRSKARASLTKAGLIDDPDKRKTLQDAIDFKGICEEMCPEYEKIQRINEMDVHQPEKNPKTTFPNTRRMVKKLARSAAGQEAPLPMDVRSVPALKRTFDYLIDELLRNDDNLPFLHGFLWDRTRAIRRDFTFFSSLNPEEMKTQVYVLENITRFHVTALHLLSQEGNAPEDFVEQQEIEQLAKALLSLRDAYDDCNDQGIRCENEPEFRAYYLIFHAMDSNIIETLQRQWKPNLWKDSDAVRTAASLVEALQNTQDFHGPIKDAPSMAASAAYHSYFRIVEDPKVSYTMACFAEIHFAPLRRSILTTIKKSLARPRETAKDVTAAVLNKFLRFDSIDEAIDFAEDHDFEFGDCEDDPSDITRKYLKLDNRKRLPFLRYHQQFSESLVEKKRGSRSLPDLIHQTIYEDPNAPKPTTNGGGEGSLFVTDEPEPTAQVQPVESSKPNSTTNPFSSFKPNGVLGSNNAVNGNSGTLLNGNASASTSPFQQSTPQQNPFAPTPAPAAEPTKPAVNPFASATTSTAPSPFSNGITTTSNESGVPAGATTTAALNSFTPSTAPSTSAGPAKSNPFGWPPSSESQTPKAPSFPSFTPQPTVPSNDAPTPPSKVDKPTSLLPSAPATPAVEPTKTTDNNAVPPSSKPTVDAFQQLKPTPPPLGNVAKPISGLGIGTPLPSTDKQDKPASSVLSSSPAAISTPQLSFPAFSTPSYQPSPLGITPQPATTSPPKPTIQTPQPPTLPPAPLVPPAPPAPPRDLVGDLTKWYVLGDEGMLGDFQAFMLDNILQGVYRKFVKDKERKRQKEEEEKALAKATEFRRYTLSVRYFYRWRDTARELRLSQLRRSGREQMRMYYEAQRAEQLKAQKAEARRVAREKAEIAELNRHRPEELMDLLKHKKPGKRRQSEEDALLASGVLSGVGNEREAVAQIVNGPPSVNGTVSSQQSKLSGTSTARGGSKTQALREQLLGDRSSTFRRSLPPSMSGNGSSPEPSNRVSKVSERWRLKAMGIVQMPDGTAMPESLANEIQYGKKRHSGTGTMGPPSSSFIRRASVSDLARSEGGHRLSNSHGAIDTTEFDGSAANNKRKRAVEDDEDTPQQGASNTHKRVMSDAQKLISELRAMRAEMEEGASWFHDQNERLHSEMISRGSTPWDQDS